MTVQRRALFDRLTSVHRPDCALFADGPLPMPVAGPDDLAPLLGSDQAARYADACHPVFEDLRRVVGQLAGLMILAQLTDSSEVAGLGELASCRQRFAEAGERIRLLAAPGALEPHREQLVAAHAFSGLALGTFSELRPRGDNEAAFDKISRHVRRAYAHLSAATAEKAGLAMVDLSHACCSCGR
ncbi:hypothetical protein [Ancylobacter sp.]|uniref:hypothetical protein n=1 Tax=Ancylobacter sp. TaxID=1872567 RepID=UPI003BABE787